MHPGSSQGRHFGSRRERPAQLINAPVVRHTEQPGLQSQLPVVGSECPVGPHEDVLEGIFGILPAGEHLARVAKETFVVPVVDGLEGLVVSGPKERQQLLVRPKPQQTGANHQAWPGEGGGCVNRGGFQELQTYHWAPRPGAPVCPSGVPASVLISSGPPPGRCGLAVL
jgi:hypothetical protein